MYNIKNEKIDIIIPWVDSEDNKWKIKKHLFLKKISANSSDEMTSDNRYDDYGTLKFVLRSIDKFMPWVNSVIIVTDDQKPDWINEKKVRIVDHTEFIEGKLPTFNSNTIMTNLYKIPGLSEKFIILNDDFVLWSYNEPTDYFRKGKPVDLLIESATVPREDGFFHISQNGVAIANRLFHKRKIMKANIFNFFNLKYGFNQIRTLLSLPYAGFVGFFNPHFPVGYLRSNFIQFADVAENELKNTWQHRFRNPSDINEWAVRYFRNLNGEFIPGKLKGQYLTIKDFENRVKIKSNIKVLVINDDGCRSKNALNQLEQILEDKFGDKSRYEI